MNTSFSLPIRNEAQRKLAIAWLAVAVGFLLASGIYPLLLALARTTYEMPWKDFFYTALIMHVDFTVLWWLIAFAGVFWTLNASLRLKSVGWWAVAMFIFGGLIAAISPLTADSNPLTNNYVPILENRYFMKGLIVFGTGVFFLVSSSMVDTFWKGVWNNTGEGALRFGVFTSVLAAFASCIALIWTWIVIPDSLEGRAYYETLFWAGGHILQFAHTALVAVSWLWLATFCGVRISASPRLVMVLFGLGMVSVVLVPWVFIAHEVGDPEFMKWFVLIMRDGNSLAAAPIGLIVLWGLFGETDPGNPHLKAGLVLSILLFGIGGILGLFIAESSTLITAHYHGSITGVTMAFMAMTYLLLPYFGFAAPKLRLATIQIFAYGIGQFIHITGLAWGGGHGMKRKIVGTAQDIGIQSIITPQDLVGLGGVIAVLSGILFAAVVLPIMLKGPQKSKEEEERGNQAGSS